MTQASAQVSINGGAWQSGWVIAPAGATVDFRQNPAATAGVKSVTWELLDYAPELGLPSGWSNVGGIYTSYAALPPTVTLPTNDQNGWGGLAIRERVNGNPNQYDDTGALVATYDPSLTDESTVVLIPSPGLGLYGLTAGQRTQFDALRAWVGSIMHDLRLIDAAVAGGAVSWANDLPTSSNTHQYVSNISGGGGAGGTIGLGDGTHDTSIKGTTSSAGTGPKVTFAGSDGKSAAASNGSAANQTTVQGGAGGAGQGTDKNGGRGADLYVLSGPGGAKTGAGTAGAGGDVHVDASASGDGASHGHVYVGENAETTGIGNTGGETDVFGSDIVLSTAGGSGSQTVTLGLYGLSLSSATVSATSGTTTLGAAQYAHATIVVAASLTNNLTLVFPNQVGIWFLDLSGLTFNGHTLTLQSGSATVAVTAATSTTNLGIVRASGSNGLACNI